MAAHYGKDMEQSTDFCLHAGQSAGNPESGNCPLPAAPSILHLWLASASLFHSCPCSPVTCSFTGPRLLFLSWHLGEKQQCLCPGILLWNLHSISVVSGPLLPSSGKPAWLDLAIHPSKPIFSFLQGQASVSGESPAHSLARNWTTKPSSWLCI